MMGYVLLVILSSSSPTVMTQRFPNLESCRVAKVWVVGHLGATEVQAECLEDLREEPTAAEGQEEPYQMHDSTGDEAR